MARELLAPAWDQGEWGRVVGIGYPMWRQMQLSEERQGWWKGLWQVWLSSVLEVLAFPYDDS